MFQGAVNVLHESTDPRNPNKLPRLVYPGSQQQQQQQQQQQHPNHQTLLQSGDDSEISFPDAFMGAALHGPLFV